jgi:hypothetical protein
MRQCGGGVEHCVEAVQWCSAVKQWAVLGRFIYQQLLHCICCYATPLPSLTCCCSCRCHQCLQSKPRHIYNKFSWGNLASLWTQPHAAGIDVRQHIIDYYR